jgi:hypothetical protein
MKPYYAEARLDGCPNLCAEFEALDDAIEWLMARTAENPKRGSRLLARRGLPEGARDALVARGILLEAG